MRFKAYALLVLGALLVPVWVDLARPWQAIQRDGLDWHREQLRAALSAVESSVAADTERLEHEVEVASEQVRQRADEIAELERLRFRLARQLGKARAREVAARHQQDLPAQRDARIEVESYTEMEATTQQQIDELRAPLTAAQSALAAARAERDGLADRLAANERGRFWRRTPVLGALAPSLGVREITVAGGIGQAGATASIDRCPTCHLGATWHDLPASPDPTPTLNEWQRSVWTPHPRSELIGPTSAHPIPEIGCTACHGGDGLATDFSRAGHVPHDDVQANLWRQRWNWRPEAAELRILTGSAAEAGCVTCHGDAVWIEGAPTQAAGRRLIAELGCAGCHRTGRQDLDQAPLAGPALDVLAAKTTAAQVESRLAAPDNRFWSVWGHTTEAAGIDLHDPTLRRAVIARLFAEAPTGVVEQPSVAGDPSRGQVLFSSLGCRACHRLAETPDLATIERLRGPDLHDLGQRASAAWVRSWLLDPKSWRADTLMPNLRLSDRQATDLAAFLIADSAPGSRSVAEDNAGTAVAKAPPDRSRIDTQLGALWQRTMTVEASEARLEALTHAERRLALGEAALHHLGCAGCHRLPATVEAMAPSGGDLTTIGAEWRHGPRVGPVEGWPHSASRRPDAPTGALGVETAFADRAAPARAIWIQWLGWQDDRPRSASSPVPGTAQSSGRAVMERHGCRACHALAGARGLVETAMANRPPSLAVAGQRLRSEWLVQYLRDPGRTNPRPWLKVPMPTFDLTHDELEAIARSFAHRAGVPLVAWQAPDDGVGTSVRRATERAVGRAVYDMMQCGRCHPGAEATEQVGVEAWAPDYRLARQRLRPSWVEALLLDPATALQRPDAGGMTPPWPLDAAGHPETSFLSEILDAPMFAVQRARLRRLFASDEALEAYLADPEAVTKALRAHLWSLADTPPAP